MTSRRVDSGIRNSGSTTRMRIHMPGTILERLNFELSAFRLKTRGAKMAEAGGAQVVNAEDQEAGRGQVMSRVSPEDYESEGKDRTSVKVICLGDSAVGKSKLVERFLANDYKRQQQSTYALNLYKYETTVSGKSVIADFWDTAGQERFNSMHSSYYHQAHACILVFDVTRKLTYKNLHHWYSEMREHRPDIPCILVANKIDVDYKVTQKSFRFARNNHLPFYFVSAADGTNVVKVFSEAVTAAVAYKHKSTDFLDQVMQELERMDDLSSVQPVVPPSPHLPPSSSSSEDDVKSEPS